MKNNIKKLRTERNITQTQLTMMTGIPTATISGLETGKRDIPIDLLIKLAVFYNVSIDYILNRTNKKEFDRQTI